jgi:hypothetical protein
MSSTFMSTKSKGYFTNQIVFTLNQQSSYHPSSSFLTLKSQVPFFIKKKDKNYKIK